MASRGATAPALETRPSVGSPSDGRVVARTAGRAGARFRARSARTGARVAGALLSLLVLSGLPTRGSAQEPLPDFLFDVPIDTEAWQGRLVDFVRVWKGERRLELHSEGELISSYEISLGGQPLGHKREQGDQRTPEGRYVIDWRKSDSAYHLALHISYPNEEDQRQAAERGVDPGGAIMIHGLPNALGVIGSAHTVIDWTDGCIAVTNAEIEEIWERVPDGVPIEILP